MAKQRYINTKFWDDAYIISLTPNAKLLFLYLLTNPLTNIAGCYEISLRRIHFDTGLSEAIIQSTLDTFKDNNKIFYLDSWIVIKNFIKNQSLNPKITKGIAVLIQQELPPRTKQRLLGIMPEINYFEDIALTPSRAKEIRQIIDKKGAVCQECSNEFQKEDLEVHHKVPLFKNGTNKIENLQVLCSSCHKSVHQLIGYDSLSKANARLPKALNYTNSNSNSNSNSNPNFNSNSPPQKKKNNIYEINA